MKVSVMRFQNILVAAAIVAVPVIMTMPSAHADQAAIYTSRFSNVAVQGHDPVAYFTEGKPLKGSKKFTATYEGAEFRFASVENLEMFEADPAKYAPQYGGYCAWAIAQGYTAKGDKDNWAIVDGKLYLNYNNKIQKKWNKDRDGFINLADTNWLVVLVK